MNQEYFSNKLKELRKKNNLTQKELADKLGVTYQAISKWENNKNMPDIILLKEISNIFNIDIDELLTGNKKKNNNKILLLGIILLFLIVLILISILKLTTNTFEFKTMTSNCDDFTITGSAAYNNKKTSIYIADVNYCGKENNTIYTSFTCDLYEDYRSTLTKIGSCGSSKRESTLTEFVEEINLNVNNYVASCKMFTSSLLYMEIHAIDKLGKTNTYKIPINLEENCSK